MKAKIHLIDNESGINFSVQKSNGYYEEDGKIVMCEPSIIFLLEEEGKEDTAILTSKEDAIELATVLLELSK